MTDTQTYGLLVEDSPTMNEDMCTLLRVGGYTIQSVRDGEQALEILRDDAQPLPAFIISGGMLPRLNGYAFLQAVRANPAWAQIPFAIVTASASPANQERAEALGVTEFMAKPFTPDDLFALVIRLLRLEE
jgi:two-component system chemotaxis response regulator CheY